MSDRWESLRSKFQGKTIDLDAEFEKFLNESLSDESLASPRHKTPPIRSSKDKGTLPWWAEEDEDEDDKRETLRKSWIKQKPTKDDDDEKGDTDALKDVAANQGTQPTPVGISQDSCHGDITAMSMSKDSLDEGTRPSLQKGKFVPKDEEDIQESSIHEEEDKDIPTYSDIETSLSASPVSPGQVLSPDQPPPGLETLEEQEDKKRFFQQEGVDSQFDYEDKLHGITSTESPSPDRHDQLLQATGVEIGDSIFNATENNQVERTDDQGVDDQGVDDQGVDDQSVDDQGAGERDNDYSDEFEDTGTHDKPDSDAAADEGPVSKTTHSVLRHADQIKPSLLSKVSLMDSLDSTLDRNKTLPKQQRENLNVTEGTKSGTGLRATGTSNLGNAYSGTTDTIAELQAALRQVQMDATDKTDYDTGTHVDDGEHKGQLMIKKTPTGDTESRGFSAKPVVITDNTPVSDEQKPRGNLTKMGSAGFTITSDSIDSASLPVDCRGFSLQPSVPVPREAEGGLAVDSHGIPLESRVVPLGPPKNIRTSDVEDGRGFDLKPVADLLTIIDQEVGRKEYEDGRREYEDGRKKHEDGRREYEEVQREYEDKRREYEDGRRDYGDKRKEHEGGRRERKDRRREYEDGRREYEDGRREYEDKRREYDDEVEEDEEEDTPPPDSLRSIKAKAKARKSVDVTKRSKKVPPSKKGSKDFRSPVRARGSRPTSSPGVAKKAARKDRDKNHASSKKQLDPWRPSMSSPPSWSPTPSMRKSRQTDSKIPIVKSKSATTRHQEDNAIVKSVESFASYLKHLVRPDDQDNQSPPTPRWSDDEPIKSRSSVRVTSTEDRLERISREKRLQAEVENWQEAWKEERRRNDKLIADMAARERELSRKEEKTRMAYEQQIHDLKQEVYSVQARLKEEQESADNRKRVASGGNLKGISEEEKKKLEKEIREQEKLMQGYQQENERLYKELKQIQAKAKTTEGKMFAENQKLATEVANVKEKLDQNVVQSNHPTPGSAILGADRINYLQDQLGSYKKRETKFDKELDELRRANTTLEQRMRGFERERDNAVERANQALGTSTQEQSEIKQRYQNEVERLNRKLKWYAENQEMLDRDLVKMKLKDQEITELKDTLERLRAHQGKAAVEKKERTNERAADAKRIRDLERQVREMEEIIKRRYPNSLPALIFAAASAPGFAQPVSDESPKKQSPSYVFLEQQVKKLETQLEEKDDESSRRIRALEQKHNAMKFDYEERIKELEESLRRAKEKTKSTAHPFTHAQALEKELAAVREGDRRRISELENEVSVLQEALSRVSAVQAHVKNKKKKPDGKKSTPAAEVEKNDESSIRVQTLERQLQEKEKDLLELRQTCLKLQQERESLLASPQRNTQPPPHTPPRVAELERQNNALKQRLSDINLNMDQDRVRYQASLAEAERNARQSRDDAADQIEKLKAQHLRELNHLKGDFAVRHSTSVVTEHKSKIASQEIVIQKLRDKVLMESRNAEDLAAAKVREEVLKQQLANLQNELRQAKENFTPEMRHFDGLQSKITAMEQRFKQRESDLERIINNVQIKSKIEKDESDSNWKSILKKKNQEIDQFREELDVILEALKELKRQGVVIPMVANRFY